jgi:sulfite reductase beta subunit-like hemoprotein
MSSDQSGMYLRSVGREEVPIVIDALFRNYTANHNDHEDMGSFHRRVGADSLINFLKNDPATSAMMAKPFTTDFVIDHLPN